MFLAPTGGLFGQPAKPEEKKDGAATTPGTGLFGGLKKDESAEKKDAPAGKEPENMWFAVC